MSSSLVSETASRSSCQPPRRPVVGVFGDPNRHTGGVKVLLRNPRREIEVHGARTVNALLCELSLVRESHLVIRNGELVPGDAALAADDTVEVRPVISGGG